MLLEEGGFSGVTARELVRYVNNICMYVCIPCSSGKVRLVNYLRNVGSIGWVLALQEYMTQRLLPLQKHPLQYSDRSSSK